MSRKPLHALTWSQDLVLYELSTSGQLQQQFSLQDENAWLTWLAEERSFAFQGIAGRLNVYRETRGRAGQYWYAYHTNKSGTRKRYLGRTPRVTFARLEEVTKTLSSELSSKILPGSAPLASLQSIDAVRPTQPETPPNLAHLAAQKGTLLMTRFSYPRQPGSLVTRERLLQELDSARTRPLTLLSAAAGWGKTTLLSSWASRHSRQVAWISLDRLDNDPFCFWVSVITALRQCASCPPNVGAIALAMLQSMQPPALSGILATLINDLTNLSQEILLLMDDYQVITDQAIHESLAFLLEHLPAHLHLVLASRADPELPLARWRARGQLTEIRTADLRFTAAEVSVFITQALGDVLTREDILLLERRTEGWIAGLQLAVLAMQKRENLSAFVQTFTGNHRYLLDYIQEEILQRQPLSIQHFLLQTAVLTRMNASLCEALTQETASQEILEILERNNLFVVPLDEERQWYRLHDLFRDVLLARLHATQPELVPLLQQRAARWHDRHGDVREAVTYALAAQDNTFAAALMERAAQQMWRQGEAQLLHTWITTLPEKILRAHARLALTSALHLLHNTQYMPDALRAHARTQVEQTIAMVEHTIQSQQEEPLSETEQKLLFNRIRQLRGWQKMRGAYLGNEAKCLQAISQEMQELVKDEELHWKMMPTFSLVLSANLMGDLASLVPLLQEMKILTQQAQDQYLTIRIMQWLADTYLESGHLHRSYQECFDALALLDQIGGQITTQGYLHFHLTEIHFMWNQVAEAQAHVHKVMHHARTWRHLDLLAWGYYVQVRLLIAAGDLAGAEQTLQEAEQLVRQNGLALHLPRVEAAQAHLWLAQSNLAAAGAWADHFVFNTNEVEHMQENAYRALAWVYLTQQKYAQALEVLTPLLSRAERDQRGWDVMHILVLQVLAFQGLGARAQARDSALRLLTLTEPEGCIRVYLDAGEPMKQLLVTLLAEPQNDEHSLTVIFRSYIARLLAAFEQVTSTPAKNSAGFLAETSQEGILSGVAAPASLMPYSPLSPQEERVLRLLATGQSIPQIAREFVVSVNTIRTQVQSIYRKLDVHNRVEASEAARHLRLR